jgi:hypothetical protein
MIAIQRIDCFLIGGLNSLVIEAAAIVSRVLSAWWKTGDLEEPHEIEEDPSHEAIRNPGHQELREVVTRTPEDQKTRSEKKKRM